MQALGMSNLRYTYCFRTRQNQDAARPTRFPDHGASRKGQSRAACSLVSLPTFRRYQGTAEGHGQDCGAIQKVRRHDSGPGEKDRFLSLVFATVLLPPLRIFWIPGLQQTLCLCGLEKVQNKSLGCNRLRYRKNTSQRVPTTNCVGYNPTLSAAYLPRPLCRMMVPRSGRSVARSSPLNNKEEHGQQAPDRTVPRFRVGPLHRPREGQPKPGQIEGHINSSSAGHPLLGIFAVKPMLWHHLRDGSLYQ